MVRRVVIQAASENYSFHLGKKLDSQKGLTTKWEGIHTKLIA